MLSALCWIPRGAAKAVLVAEEPTPEELAALAQQGLLPDDEGDEWEEAEDDADVGEEDDEDDDADDMDAEEAAAHAQQVASAIGSGAAGPSGTSERAAGRLEEALKELRMDQYDDEDNGDDLMGRMLGGGSSKPGLAYYHSNDDDPYITAKDDSDSEVDDFTIRETDILLLTARHEDDVSNIVVWVYEEPSTSAPDANLYVHHDVMLPAFPLCLAWMNHDPTQKQEKSNMVAVGTFEPAIEIWDLDVIDTVQPVAVLGGADTEAAEEAAAEGSKKKKKKKKKALKLKEGSHTDAVLGLSWNREYRNVLASASADHTVKVWDMAAQKCEHTLTHHSGKVQAVAWNPAESPVLLSGSFDQTACLSDVRTPGGDPLRWRLTADVEALGWCPHAPTSFLVSSEDGLVTCLDARLGAGSQPLYQLSAHDKPTCVLSFCARAPGLLATASTDKKVKFWDVGANEPSLLAVHEVKPVGAVFGAGFCSDVPHLFASGGAKGTVQVMDVRSLAPVVARFPQLAQGAGAPVAAPVLGGADAGKEE